MTTTPLGAFPLLTRQYSNITPFTYRDGLTYLEVLEGLRTWIYDVLVPHIDTEIGGLSVDWTANVDLMLANTMAQLEAQDIAMSTKVSEMTAYVDTAVLDIINATITVSDPIMTAVIDNVASVFRERLTTMFVGKGTLVTNVKEYGAKGVGFTNDTVAINAAIAAG